MSGYKIAILPMLTDDDGTPIGILGGDGIECYLPRFSADLSALLKPDGTALAGQGVGYVLPPATANALGGVKVGAGLAVDGNGVLTASGGAGGGSAANDIGFTTNVPLTNTAGTYMPNQAVNSAFAFTLAAGAVRGAFTSVGLIAGAGGEPTFPGFTKHSSSLDWDNTAGVLNIVQFFHLAGTAWYSI